MSIYEKMKKAIEEQEHDKKHNPIVWVAQFNAKDDKDEKLVRLGIRQERHLTFIYFDFDTNDSDGVASTQDEAMEQIEQRWSDWETFKWIK